MQIVPFISVIYVEVKFVSIKNVTLHIFSDFTFHFIKITNAWYCPCIVIMFNQSALKL